MEGLEIGCVILKYPTYIMLCDHISIEEREPGFSFFPLGLLEWLAEKLTSVQVPCQANPLD